MLFDRLRRILPILTSCSPTWAKFWAILGNLGPILEPSWAILGPSWAHLGPIWNLSCAHLGAILGPRRTISALFGRLLGLCFAIFELRSALNFSRDCAKNLSKTRAFGFLEEFLSKHLGKTPVLGFLERRWGERPLLGVLGCSGVFWGVLGRFPSPCYWLAFSLLPVCFQLAFSLLSACSRFAIKLSATSFQ